MNLTTFPRKRTILPSLFPEIRLNMQRKLHMSNNFQWYDQFTHLTGLKKLPPLNKSIGINSKRSCKYCSNYINRHILILQQLDVALYINIQIATSNQWNGSLSGTFKNSPVNSHFQHVPDNYKLRIYILSLEEVRTINVSL